MEWRRHGWSSRSPPRCASWAAKPFCTSPCAAHRLLRHPVTTGISVGRSRPRTRGDGCAGERGALLTRETMTEKPELRERRPYERCHTDRRFADWLRVQGLAQDDGATSPPYASS